MKITILGTGSMGTALAHLISNNGHKVILWGIDKEAVSSINRHHRNCRTLSELSLPASASATLDITQALKNSQVIILAVPVQATAEVMRKVKPLVASKMVFLSVSY